MANYFHIRTLALVFLIAFPGCIQAKNRTVNLYVGYKTVNFTGKPFQAMAINDQIPGPTLHFKEGDTVTINVHNRLDQGTAIHWHGILLPWKMDGVAGVTQQPIPPGGVFHYHFKLKQSGTYWYHAHADLQEQRGVYGGLIIDPKHERYHYNKDFVIILSDWMNSCPNQVYQNLKKEGDFYTAKFPIQPSLSRYLYDLRQAKTTADKNYIKMSYKMMQTMRMSNYDLSDIAYDTVLLNGHSKRNPWIKNVKVGDTVRLRFIDAGASTIFNVKIPGSTMQLIHVQGNDVVPYNISSFTFSPGETYDVLLHITKQKPYIIYAESIDTLNNVYGLLKTLPNQTINPNDIPPFPDPKPVLMMNHSQHSKQANQHGMHSSHMATEKSTAKPTVTKYSKLKAVVKTNNPNKPYHIIRMNLTGFMHRYIWFLNGKPEYQAKPILIQHGKRYRIIFKNNTMMNHPMHIHGHWFILRNGHGAYDPLLHTINVPPGATIIADFDADTKGQWYFHCHNLFHMKAGMANIIRYTDSSTKAMGHQHQQDNYQANNPYRLLPGHRAIGWNFANGIDINAAMNRNAYEGSLDMLFGKDFNRLELMSEDAEISNGKVESADLDIFYWRLISQFWAIKGGVNYFGRPAEKPYWQPGIGIEGTMPYFIQTNIRTYLRKGSVKFDLDFIRNTQLARNFYFQLNFRSIFATKTITNDFIGSGLNELQYSVRPFYQFNGNLLLYIQYQHSQYYGTTKSIFVSHGEGYREDLFSIGASILF